MILKIFLTKMKSIFLFFINLFRRALCCFRRRRRISENSDTLSHIVVNDSHNANELDQWNDWEFRNRKPESVQEYIECYRQQQTKIARQQSEELIEEHVDLFEDMTPKITKQKVILLESPESGRKSLNLEAQQEDFLSNELENWEDDSGWDKDSIDLETQKILREKKKQEREKRAKEQFQKRLDKTSKPNVLGARVTT